MKFLRIATTCWGQVIFVCTWILVTLMLSACATNRITTPLPSTTPSPLPLLPTVTKPSPATATLSPTPTPSPLPPTATNVPPTQTPTESPRVLIPAGEFMMGNESGVRDEGPAHKVYLDAFFIDVYEVTNAQYAECVAAGACTPLHNKFSQTRLKYYGEPEFANYPVLYVLWEQARAYCQWRDGDLPTEAQWEKAARGGLEGKTYFWGDTFIGTEANLCDANCNQVSSEKAYDDGFPDTSPVGSFAPNGYGLYDMAGNVWDWTLDWYSMSYFESSPYKNPTGPENGEDKVARGGSWYFGVGALRVTYRERGDTSEYYSDAGMRCVYSP